MIRLTPMELSALRACNHVSLARIRTHASLAFKVILSRMESVKRMASQYCL